MIRIDIQGMESSEKEIERSVPAHKVEGLPEEFSGEISIQGLLKRIKDRYTLHLNILASAELTCDISLKKFTEKINAELDLSFVANNEMYEMKDEESDEPDDSIVIREDFTFLDITKRVAEELVVSLPMKRISPEYQGKDVTEIYPDHTVGSESNEDEIDERWKKLKQIKIN